MSLKDNVIQIVDAHSQITDNLPLSSDTTSMEVEEGMSNNENVIESVLTTLKSLEKAEPQPEFAFSYDTYTVTVFH